MRFVYSVTVILLTLALSATCRRMGGGHGPHHGGMGPHGRGGPGGDGRRGMRLGDEMRWNRWRYDPNARVNNGWTPETDNPDHCYDSADFEGYEISQIFRRGYQIHFKAEGEEETKYYLYQEKPAIQLVDELSDDDLADLGIGNPNMMGGFQKSDNAWQLESALKASDNEDIMEYTSEECRWDFQDAYQQVVAGMNYIVKVYCGEEEEEDEGKYVKIYVPLGAHECELVTESSEAVADLAPLCPWRVQQNLIEQGINVEPFVRQHCQFQGAAQVQRAAYVPMPTGRQYLVQIADETDPERTSVLALHDFEVEGTKPYVIAQPFPDWPTGMQFIEQMKMFAVSMLPGGKD